MFGVGKKGLKASLFNNAVANENTISAAGFSLALANKDTLLLCVRAAIKSGKRENFHIPRTCTRTKKPAELLVFVASFWRFIYNAFLNNVPPAFCAPFRFTRDFLFVCDFSRPNREGLACLRLKARLFTAAFYGGCIITTRLTVSVDMICKRDTIVKMWDGISSSGTQSRPDIWTLEPPTHNTLTPFSHIDTGMSSCVRICGANANALVRNEVIMCRSEKRSVTGRLIILLPPACPIPVIPVETPGANLHNRYHIWRSIPAPLLYCGGDFEIRILIPKVLDFNDRFSLSINNNLDPVCNTMNQR